MSRYGWSSRDQLSPYTPVPSGIPAVTDEDFSYITSQDLDDVDTQYYPRSHSLAPVPEDDVLLIKNRGVTYPAHFPAYAIGDGKLTVKDVKDRVGIMMELPSRGVRRIKLLYKGRQLKDALAAVRDYGVKNNSELMAVIPELDDGSSPSEEEMVIVDAPRQDSKRRKKKKSSKKKGDGEGSSVAASSPRDSASTFDVPRSPPPPHLVPSGATSGPLKQLDDLCNEFITKWLPMCENYMASPPADPKKRQEEHLKLSESILQHILIKLDGVDTDGIAEVRARRKGLVNHVQETLKKIDLVKNA